jgi:hypothetical protein
MTAQPLQTPTIAPTEHLPVGELSRRLAAELASAAAICRDCEHIAGDLANGGAALENLSRLQALDELSQRLHGLSDGAERIGQHASGEWSMSIEPLLKAWAWPTWSCACAPRNAWRERAEAGELDFF